MGNSLPAQGRCVMSVRLIRLLIGQDYKVGSMPPSGYLAKQEWAEAQHKGGLCQRQCIKCGKWLFPQQADNHICPDYEEREVGRG